MGDGVARCSNGELPHYDPDMLASTYLKSEVYFIRIRHFKPSYGPSLPNMKVKKISTYIEFFIYCQFDIDR